MQMYNSISNRLKKLEQTQLQDETPINIFKDPATIEFFTNSSIFSTETVTAILSAVNEKDFNPIALCTSHELSRMLFVLDSEYRQEEIERSQSHLWKRLREFESAEIEELCAITEKLQRVDL